MDNNMLKEKILNMLVTRLQLPDVEPKTYDYDAALFFDTNEESILELDSVDSLEIIVGLKQEFGVVLGEEDMEHLYSINTIVNYILDKEAFEKSGTYDD